MDEYIKRQAAIDELGKPPEVYSWEDALMREQWERDKAAIEAVPPADVRPVVRGEWIDDGCITRCKYCGEEKEFPHWRFCPNCGADMRDENDG